MSLTDLEIRTHTKPILAELDRQKEKAAAFKKERNAMEKKLEEMKQLITQVAYDAWSMGHMSGGGMFGHEERRRDAVAAILKERGIK